MSSSEPKSILPGLTGAEAKAPDILSQYPDPDPGAPLDAKNLTHLIIFAIGCVTTLVLRLYTNVAIIWCILAGIVVWCILYCMIMLCIMYGFEDPLEANDQDPYDWS